MKGKEQKALIMEFCQMVYLHISFLLRPVMMGWREAASVCRCSGRPDAMQVGHVRKADAPSQILVALSATHQSMGEGKYRKSPTVMLRAFASARS